MQANTLRAQKLCYHPRMGRMLCSLVCLVAAAASLQAADRPDPLARARASYNQGNFDAAIGEAGAIAGAIPGVDLVAARAYLERFRMNGAPDDLENARLRLRRLDPRRLTPLERVELIVGLGEELYVEESYGAAATIFASVLDAPPAEGRERVLDWWASALDRVARSRPGLDRHVDRQVIYDQVTERMKKELASHPESASAVYWLAAAARGSGDLQAAWDAVEGGWVRAPLTRDAGTALRIDLDRLMLEGIVPERARALSQPADSVRMEWERFKARWKAE